MPLPSKDSISIPITFSIEVEPSVITEPALAIEEKPIAQAQTAVKKVFLNFILYLRF